MSDEEYVNDEVDDAIRAACGFPTWRPIETIPLYEEVLVFFPSYEFKNNPFLKPGSRMPATMQIIAKMRHTEWMHPPTHWMPLPSPPVQPREDVSR